MRMFNKIGGLGLALGLALSVVPTSASATVLTFASYSASGSGSNIYWKNNGTTSTNGTGGSLYTIATPTATTAGSTEVTFTFNQSPLSNFVASIPATFTLLATTASGNPAQGSTFLTQTVLTGAFSFKNKNDLTVGNVFYAAGTANLLTASFANAVIFGKNNTTSGSVSGDTSSALTDLVYTSDFLDFSNTVARDYAINLSSVTAAFNRASGKALRTFRASSGGSFSSDPAPIIPGVPEPAVWGMMIVGFGMVGFASRRRTGNRVAA